MNPEQAISQMQASDVFVTVKEATLATEQVEISEKAKGSRRGLPQGLTFSIPIPQELQISASLPHEIHELLQQKKLGQITLSDEMQKKIAKMQEDARPKCFATAVFLDQKTARISSIVIPPFLRQEHLGTKLIQAAVVDLAGRGVETVVGNTVNKNALLFFTKVFGDNLVLSRDSGSAISQQDALAMDDATLGFSVALHKLDYTHWKGAVPAVT